MKHRERHTFEAEAQRQSREAAELAGDPGSHENLSLKEFAALLDEDPFPDE